MSKSKYGNSHLYMTTRELANLVLETLHDQNYFNAEETYHPQDIAYSFATVAETIGSTMSWAISQEHNANKKNAVMQTGNLRKHALPIDDEIAPITEYESGYSEYRHKNAYM